MLKPKSIQRAAKLCLWTAGDASILVVPPREAFRSERRWVCRRPPHVCLFVFQKARGACQAFV